MDDYIKRKDAIRAIEGLMDCCNGFSDTYDKACIIGVLNEVRKIDVVPVVRCGECATRDKWGCPWWKDEARPDDWYCADGEEKE